MIGNEGVVSASSRVPVFCFSFSVLCDISAVASSTGVNHL